MEQSKKTFALLTVFILLLLVGGAMYKLNFFESEKEQATKKVPSIAKESLAEVSSEQSISSITEAMKGQQQSIVGTISKRSTNKGNVFLKVTDDSGTISVPIFKDKQIKVVALTPGTLVKVSGEVDVYQGEIEIIPQAKEDIFSVEKEVSEQITSEQVGQTKTLSAEIISKYVHPKGHIFLTVQTTNGQTLKVPLFANLKPETAQYPVHAMTTIKGKISEYKGELELIPEALQDVQLTQKTLETINTKTLASIKKTDRGKQVIVEGMVDQVVEKNGHLFFELTQGKTNIKSVLFKADSQEIEGRKERIHNAMDSRFSIRVIATIDVYKDDLELIIDKVLVD